PKRYALSVRLPKKAIPPNLQKTRHSTSQNQSPENEKSISGERFFTFRRKKYESTENDKAL
uniref:hypothetical protein n=1 Tax=Paraprevotella clara TaxID=454154 RepID=UPI004026C6A1